MISNYIALKWLVDSIDTLVSSYHRNVFSVCQNVALPVPIRHRHSLMTSSPNRNIQRILIYGYDTKGTFWCFVFGAGQASAGSPVPLPGLNPPNVCAPFELQLLHVSHSMPTLTVVSSGKPFDPLGRYSCSLCA